MRYASACDGIGAAHLAFAPLDWECAWVSEIEPFASAVVAARWGFPNLGDLTKITNRELKRHGPIDLLVGGTPCQSFSVAGLRGGLADPRGNLTLAFLALARRSRAQWLLWENVPGVLSATSHEAPDPGLPDLDGDDGPRDGQTRVEVYEADEDHAFACFLAGLQELGYGFAWRVLDAQWFGLAQRRKRVFLVARLGDWAAPAAVLLEPESLRGDPPPSREACQDVAGALTRSAGTGGPDVAHAQARGLVAGPLLGHHPRSDAESETLVAQTLLGKSNASHDESLETYVVHSLRGEGHDGSEDGSGRGVPLVPELANTIDTQERRATPESTFVPLLADPLVAGEQRTYTHEGARNFRTRNVVAFNLRGRDEGNVPELTDLASVRASSGGSSRTVVGVDLQNTALRGDVAGALCAAQDRGNRAESVLEGAMVRRLTPRECERLMGFPDDYTLIEYEGRPAKDSPRYRSIGNSIAQPPLHWIARRVALVHEATKRERKRRD